MLLLPLLFSIFYYYLRLTYLISKKPFEFGRVFDKWNIWRREREREREREPRLVCVCGGGGGLCVEESKRKGRYKEEDEVNEWMRKK